jgi:5-methylcytosine-specific restriction enzyme subunit McrC
MQSVRYTPISRRFERVTELSYEIVKRRGHLTSATGDDVSGVLIDVAELWELFLLHCARRAFGAGRVEHGTAQRDGTHLLRSSAQPRVHLGRLKPDILVRDVNGALTAVVDAKYKRLRSWVGNPSGGDRGDLYQLAAYLSGHHVGLGVLAYPPRLDDDALAQAAGPWSTSTGQLARFERIPATVDEAANTLAEILTAEVAV